MLAFRDLSLQVGTAADEVSLLKDISAQFPKKHFAAILGPSGCGKSTLLKVIAGVRESSGGQTCWNGRDLELEGDFEPQEIGYVPQFSIAYEPLTVWESVENALRLRVAGLDADAREARLQRILKEVSLEDITERRVALLSGGQKRRLALAIELVSAPQLLLCDEVTSGLDPKAEDEIVRLMHGLSREDDRTVLSITHSLRHLALYDSVMVLFKGHLAYHGPADALLHYFNVEHGDELFPRLGMRKPEDWHRSWLKHRAAYYRELELDGFDAPEPESAAAASELAEDAHVPGDSGFIARPLPAVVNKKLQQAGLSEEPLTRPVSRPITPTRPLADSPSAATQFSVLFSRRWKLFFRDRGQVLLQLALLFGFPLLVVVFALDGLPQLRVPTEAGNILEQIKAELQLRTELLHTGSLVSGLIMFQVVLLSLMGSNNAAREIAGERLIFEKEKFAGLRPGAYVGSKAAFLGVLVVAQSVWMGVFVNMVVRFPGNLFSQIALLILVNAALTAICLGISSMMKSAEQASLVSVYLVGFQLPLSGAVLALPGALNALTQPFIASYWGWSGFLQTLRETRLYDAVQLVTQTHLATAPMAMWVLATHVALGLVVAYIGCKSARWE